MMLHRDHGVAAALIAFAGLAFALSGDLPLGTLASPGPGMLPYLAIALVAAFAIAMGAAARSSPPVATLSWADLPHAVRVTAAAALAALAYERAGFLVSMALMIGALLVLFERVAFWRAALYAAGVTVGARLLLGVLLKSPLPAGPFGF